MRAWRLGAVAGALAAVVTIGLASCGDDDDDGAAAPPQIEADRMRLEIQSAALPDPSTATTAANRPTVRFRVLDEDGQAVNLEAEMATTVAFPRVTRIGFTLAMLDDDGDYRSYYETTRQPGNYTYVADPEVFGTTLEVVLPPRAARTQASSPPVSANDLRNVGGGVYEYTFPAPNVTTGLDRSKTHTAAGWVARSPSQGITTSAGGAFNFVPTGGTPQRDEVISNQGCNRCHGQLTAHGTRRNVQFCVTCHSPQTGDPETDRTVDFKVMIHKIHAGSSLPSVQQAVANRRGTPYFIVGYGGSVHDYSDIAFPWHDHGVSHCTVCHTGGEDSNNWRTRPSLATCTSCHDNVQFSGTFPSCATLPAAQSFQNCLHSGGQIGVANPNSVTSCIGCHGENGPNPIARYHHGD